MNKQTTIFILNFLFVFAIYAQNKEDNNKKFDSIYFLTATNLAGKDIQRAFEVSDSLFRTSTSELQRVKSLMLFSSLHQQKGEPEQAIIKASEAEKIAEKYKLYEWQARISGFLSTQYRNIGITETGRVYLEKGLKASKKIQNQTQKNLYLGMVNQEIALYNLAEKEFEKAQKAAKITDKYFQKLPTDPQKDYFLGTNYQLLGSIHLSKKEYDTSLEYYKKALQVLEGVMEDNITLSGFIYRGMGGAYFAMKDYAVAKKYLSKADTIATTSDNINLKQEVYNSFAEFYKQTDNYDKYIFYREKYIESKNQYEENQKKTINKLVKSLQLDNNRMSKTSLNLKIGIGILAVLATGSIVFYNQKKKKDNKKLKMVIENLTQEIKVKESLIGKNKIQTENNNQDNIPKKPISISEKKEKEIMAGLREFEQNNEYLENDISMSVLAGKLKTNTIYVSHILNNRYNKDFNTYINELRIRYIVRKLKENKNYRRYKISYLAEESGFSSHSKFSAVFKFVTGFSPSAFLSYLDKEIPE